MKKIIVLQTTLLILFCSVTLSWGQQAVPEEAKRHFNRGLAAVEMAKTPADYEEAVREFEKAVQYAPNWPAAYYNLGVAQEKAGKLEESLRSLRTYLSLSPGAKDGEQVRQLIDRTEYRLERIRKEDALLAPLLGTWDRYLPETGEKLDARTFTAKDGKITVSLFGAFGEIAVPVEFDGKNVSFKYVYKTFNVDTEYEVVAQMISPTLIRGNLLSFVIRSNIKPVKVGSRGIVATELRKQ